MFYMQELSSVNGIHGVAEGILLYSERHYNRLDRQLQSTFMLDYVQMQLQLYTDKVD